MGSIPTVKVSDGSDGFFVINQADFDPKTMTEYSASEPAVPPKARPKAQPKKPATRRRAPKAK